MTARAVTDLPIKPKFGEDYLRWLTSTLGIRVDTTTENFYKSSVRHIVEEIRDNQLFLHLSDNIKDLDIVFNQDTGADLVKQAGVEILTKPYDSFLKKIYRKNVLNNLNWPEPPEGGWVNPEDAFHKVGDIVRATLVVSFLDGVPFVCENLKLRMKEVGHDISVDFEAREKGYYAAHLGFPFVVSFPDKTFSVIERNISMELQVTTQIKDAVKSILYQYYSSNRLSGEEGGEKRWQWNFETPEFKASFLGHMIHYLDAMLVESRQIAMKDQSNADRWS